MKRKEIEKIRCSLCGIILNSSLEIELHYEEHHNSHYKKYIYQLDNVDKFRREYMSNIDVYNASLLSNPVVANNLHRITKERKERIVQTQTNIPTQFDDIHLTELGNAYRLFRLHGKDIRYCHQIGKWFIWNGKCWQQDENGEIYRLAMNTVQTLYELADEIVGDDENTFKKRTEIKKFAKSCEKHSSIKNMIELASSLDGVYIHQNELDCDKFLLNVFNGTVDLQTGILRNHKRDNYLTRTLSTTYDEEAQCPQWLAFLDRIMDGNKNLIGYLQRAVGYSLSGATTEQVIFIMYGMGANGKTTFVETIRKLLKDYAQQVPIETFYMKYSDRVSNDVARLRGVRFACSTETGDNKLFDEALIKQLTGGDMITARFLYQEFFEFVPQHKIWISTNYKPIIKGIDNAIWRRIQLIPFNVIIPKNEQDPNLQENLQEELPGILNWAIAGCLDWIQNGLQKPQEIVDATDKYRVEMDILSEFFNERCETDVNFVVSASEIYEAYAAWCGKNNEKIMTNTKFGLRLSLYGFEKERGKNGRIYRKGIKLKQYAVEWD